MHSFAAIETVTIMSKQIRRTSTFANPLQRGLAHRPGMILALASSLIVLVIVMAFVALDRIEKNTRNKAGETLQTVLNTTQEALALWVEIGKYQIDEIARDPVLVGLVVNHVE